MRTAALIAAAAAALTLSACNKADDAATDGSTEATEAPAAAAAAGGYGSTSGETMDPAANSRTVTDGPMAPVAQPGDTAGNNVTETERRLNPPVAQ